MTNLQVFNRRKEKSTKKVFLASNSNPKCMYCELSSYAHERRWSKRVKHIVVRLLALIVHDCLVWQDFPIKHTTISNWFHLHSVTLRHLITKWILARNKKKTWIFRDFSVVLTFLCCWHWSAMKWTLCLSSMKRVQRSEWSVWFIGINFNKDSVIVHQTTGDVVQPTTQMHHQLTVLSVWDIFQVFRVARPLMATAWDMAAAMAVDMEDSAHMARDQLISVVSCWEHSLALEHCWSFPRLLESSRVVMEEPTAAADTTEVSFERSRWWLRNENNF